MAQLRKVGENQYDVLVYGQSIGKGVELIGTVLGQHRHRIRRTTELRAGSKHLSMCCGFASSRTYSEQ